jgi:O-antigen ligase
METVSSLESVKSVNEGGLAGVARLLDPFVFYGLLVVIVLAAIPYGTVEPWWAAILECVVLSLGILGLIEGLISKRPWAGLSLAAPLVVLALFILFQSVPLFSARDNAGLTSLRLSLSADPFGTRLFAVKMFVLIVVGMLLLRYTSSKGRLRSLIYVVIGVGVASAVFGIVRKNFQQGPGFFLPYLNSDRGFGQFINRNHFAFLMEMALGLSLGLVVGEVGRHRRAMALFPIIALLWAALIYSNSRGGIMASLGQLLFLGVLLDPVRRLTEERTQTTWRRFQNLAGGLALRGFLVVCLIVLFAYGVAWIGGEPVVTNFQLAATDFSQQEILNNANTSRKEIWSTTWRLIKARPFAGVGFGAYWIGITRYHNASGELTPQQAHNDYLELMASGGLIGCALVVWFVAVFLQKTRRRLRSPDPYQRAACLGAVTGIFGIAIHSFVDFGLHITINALILSTLIVIAVTDSCPEDKMSAYGFGFEKIKDKK